MLGAAIAGATLAVPAVAMPVVTSDDEPFARTWLAYWEKLGGTVHLNRAGGFTISMMEFEFYRRNDSLPPHLELWNAEQHSGAVRGAHQFLDLIPGGRESVRRLLERLA